MYYRKQDVDTFKERLEYNLDQLALLAKAFKNIGLCETEDKINTIIRAIGHDEKALLKQKKKIPTMISDELIQELNRILNIDDSKYVCEGIPDYVIEAGMDAQDKIDDDLKNYESGVTPDWDQGMIAAFIFKQMMKAWIKGEIKS